jgi:hypothetical protein
MSMSMSMSIIEKPKNTIELDHYLKEIVLKSGSHPAQSGAT